MAEATLVENQIDDGQRLIERLVQSDFPVTCAGWVKTSEDGLWFLYLASPVVDAAGPLQAYRRLHPLIRHMPPPFWIDPFDVKLVSPDDPIAKAVLDIHRRYPARIPARYGGDHLGGVSIEGAYIYPPIGDGAINGPATGRKHP